MPNTFKSFTYVTKLTNDDIARTSLPASSAWQKVLYKKVSWLVVESTRMKLGWKDERLLLSRRWLNRCLNTNLSKTLSRLLNKEIGRYLQTSEASPPPLGTAILKLIGTSPWYMDWLNQDASGVDSSMASSRRMRLLIPSGPTALPTGSFFLSIALMSSVVNTRELNGSITM